MQIQTTETQHARQLRSSADKSRRELFAQEERGTQVGAIKGGTDNETQAIQSGGDNKKRGNGNRK